jgi:hypothetical protein
MRKNIVVSLIVSVVLLFIISGSVIAYMNNKNAKEVIGSNSETGTKTGTDTEVPSTNQSTINPVQSTPIPTPEPAEVEKNPIKVKALYLTGWTVGSMTKVQHYIDLAKSTEINSYVIDIKDDDGLVGYESDIPDVRDIKAWAPKYDVNKVVKAFHDNDIHLIGRVVCFKDPYLSTKNPELAVKNINGGLFKSKSKDGTLITWLNPVNRDSWPYLIEIAKEGVKKGFDEIQFDYIRYPNDGDKKAMDFGQTTQERYEVIDDFLAYAKKEMPGVVLSADVFGIICESPADKEKIGQNLEYVGKDIDYISPMVYPSHYAVGQIVNKVKFLKPDLEPYGVVFNTLAKARDRISKVENYQAKMRPYLQDFTASWLGKGYYQKYGPEQVKQQIKAAYDAGCEEWILWNSSNKYSEAGLLPE